MRSDTLLEELSLNALPALRTLHLDGWILRFGGGYSKRANSVSPLYPPAGALDLGKKIGICERLYQAQMLSPIFKLTSASYPDGLDQALATRGYQAIAPTSVQTLSLDDLPAPAGADLYGAPEPSPTWLAAAARIGEIEAEGRVLLGQMLQQIAPPSRFLLLAVEDKAVACGYAVVKAGFVGLFQIGTDRRFRRRGYARLLTHHLLQWGRAQGAHTAFLQVTRENEPALRLYESLGFREHYRYWYRIGGKG